MKENSKVDTVQKTKKEQNQQQAIAPLVDAFLRADAAEKANKAEKEIIRARIMEFIDDDTTALEGTIGNLTVSRTGDSFFIDKTKFKETAPKEYEEACKKYPSGGFDEDALATGAPAWYERIMERFKYTSRSGSIRLLPKLKKPL